jgi:hypothetical protein
MDVLAYCRAMAAFCRQRSEFEDENDAFWTCEAEAWDRLIFEYASPRPQKPNLANRFGFGDCVIAFSEAD